MRSKTGVLGKEGTKDQARQGIPWETGERTSCSKVKGARLKQTEKQERLGKWGNARKNRLSPYKVEKVGNFSKKFWQRFAVRQNGENLKAFHCHRRGAWSRWPGGDRGRQRKDPQNRI